jgi:hypothetical protein
VSCTSATMCTAFGLKGQSTDWTGGRWTTPVPVFPGGYIAAVSVSCAPPGMCMAVTSTGDAATTR